MAQFQDGYVIITKEASAPTVSSGKVAIYVDNSDQPKVVFDDASEFVIAKAQIGSSNGQPVALDNSGNLVLSTAGTSGAFDNKYTETFTAASISGGLLTVNHNLDSQYNGVYVFDENDNEIQPDDIIATDINTTTIDLTSYTVTGTWRAVILSGGSQSTGIANIATEVITLTSSQSISTPAIYVIEPPASGPDLIITIPDATISNQDQQMRFILNRVNGGLVAANIVTQGGQDIGTSATQYMGQDSRGFAIISNDGKWVIIQNSRRTQTFTWQSPEMENPNNSDWAVNSLAPAQADPINAGITIRAFDDTTEEGIGYSYTVPDWATRGKFLYISRPASAVDGDVVSQFYFRNLNAATENGSGAFWSNWTPPVTASSPLEMTADQGWRFDEATPDLRLLGLAGEEIVLQVELTRDTDNSADTLVGDWYLYQLQITLE